MHCVVDFYLMKKKYSRTSQTIQTIQTIYDDRPRRCKFVNEEEKKLNINAKECSSVRDARDTHKEKENKQESERAINDEYILEK